MFLFLFVIINLWIFSKTEQFLTKRQAFASLQHGFLKSKENVDLNNFVYT